MCTIYFIREIMGYLLETTEIICSKSVNVNINSLVVSEKNYQNTILLCNIEEASACNLQKLKNPLKEAETKGKERKTEVFSTMRNGNNLSCEG